MRRLFLVVALVAGLAACGTPTERRAVGEIPVGPGLLTGETGEFAIRNK